MGKYVSAARQLGKVTKKDDGNITIELRFTGGITSINNGAKTYETGRYPMRHWLSSKNYQLPDRPGKTSGLAQYLKNVGFETAGKGVKEMVNVVGETLTLPIGVLVGRTDKGEKQPDGTYFNANLKTRDFEIGRDAENQPIYATSVVKDGRTLLAKAKIQGFWEIK